ncbi:hypothetical protein CI109_102803 [Kwoniella shandongensis]|uniref:Uncharacterized protein n=1 Tax=Kwoniella shandongensis TaxID=1734106 RepID=A0A5M6BWJ9_9TREE|nr:uncharacterized protein CI109_004874 [Kwoniella shandongensis]KAA5526671.1 hypothetical protein CI109_004874 [Kwoniella shandongensis]
MSTISNAASASASVPGSSAPLWNLPSTIPARQVLPDRHKSKTALTEQKGKESDPGRMAIWVCLLDDRPHLHPSLLALHKHRHNVHSIPLPPDPSTDLPGTLPRLVPVPSNTTLLPQNTPTTAPIALDSTATPTPLLNDHVPTGLDTVSVSEMGTSQTGPITLDDILSFATTTTTTTATTTVPISFPPSQGTTQPDHNIDVDVQMTSPSNQSPILPPQAEQRNAQSQAQAQGHAHAQALAIEAARNEWFTWRFSEEEETRRKAYLPLA